MESLNESIVSITNARSFVYKRTHTPSPANTPFIPLCTKAKEMRDSCSSEEANIMPQESRKTERIQKRSHNLVMANLMLIVVAKAYFSFRICARLRGTLGMWDTFQELVLVRHTHTHTSGRVVTEMQKYIRRKRLHSVRCIHSSARRPQSGKNGRKYWMCSRKRSTFNDIISRSYGVQMMFERFAEISRHRSRNSLCLLFLIWFKTRSYSHNRTQFEMTLIINMRIGTRAGAFTFVAAMHSFFSLP